MLPATEGRSIEGSHSLFPIQFKGILKQENYMSPSRSNDRAARFNMENNSPARLVHGRDSPALKSRVEVCGEHSPGSALCRRS